MSIPASIGDNLKQIQARIAQAAETANRAVGDVKLIAVSKTKPIDLIKDAFEVGQLDFGENKVQELTEKHPLLPAARWHMIGHLQRQQGKIHRTLYSSYPFGGFRTTAEGN